MTDKRLTAGQVQGVADFVRGLEALSASTGVEIGVFDEAPIVVGVDAGPVVDLGLALLCERDEDGVARYRLINRR